MRLYEIDAELEALLNASVGEGGEITPEAEAAITGLEMERDAKALAVAAYIVGQRCEAEAVKAQAKRLAERAAKHEKHADSLERYLRSHLPEGHKLHDARVEIGWRRSEAVEIDVDPEELDPMFQRVTVAADKQALKAVLKTGAEIHGARLVSRVNMTVK